MKLPTIQGCLVSGLLFGISQDILDKTQEDNEGQMPKWKRERDTSASKTSEKEEHSTLPEDNRKARQTSLAKTHPDRRNTKASPFLSVHKEEQDHPGDALRCEVPALGPTRQQKAWWDPEIDRPGSSGQAQRNNKDLIKQD